MTEHVWLIHGLARRACSMNRLANALKKLGFCVHNLSYPSTHLSIEQAAQQVFQQALSETDPDATRHIVTHSLGGILLRYYLSKQPIANLGRVVMLAPPNHGSEVVDKLGHLALFRWFNGPAGSQLGTDKNSLPNQLPAADFDVGIIAGNRSINCLLSLCLPRENDGKVSVASTYLSGQRDHLVIKTSHPLIMNNKHTIRAVIQFLRHGFF